MAARFLLLLLAAVGQSFATDNAQHITCKNLKANSQGEFKILQLSDLEFTNGHDTPCLDVSSSFNSMCNELRTVKFITRLLEAEQPDLTIVTGDTIIAGATDPRQSLSTVLEPLIEYGKPWAIIFGNHDEESGLTRAQMLDHIRSISDQCCTMEGPPHLQGLGNFNLTVYQQDAVNLPVLNLVLFDSGNGFNPYGGYDWIDTSQVQWFKRTAFNIQKMRDRNHPEHFRVPILLFFHIPLPEFRILLEEEYEKRITGNYQEKVWHSGINGGLYAAALENGNVHGMFVGHDHLNDFCHRNIKSGIYLCYGGSAGYGAYGKAGFDRRARLIQANTQGALRTWKRLDDDQLSIIDEEKILHLRGHLNQHPDLQGNLYIVLPASAWKFIWLAIGFVVGGLTIWFAERAIILLYTNELIPPQAISEELLSLPWSWPWSWLWRKGVPTDVDKEV